MSIPGVESLNPVWWAAPWWEDILYQKECSLSLQQMRTSIEHLKRLFDEEWAQRSGAVLKKHRNPPAGESPDQVLICLASLVCRSSAAALPCYLCRREKTPQHFNLPLRS